ncbi:UNVERIFIED_CONTAM: hypothetical protein Scaly_2723700 [Sesamum calycinum]|uniref:Transposase MuDR plant domain-containing protein n=1 Tax=Sesamum calycinum TaxID=2727403 RepID=A0AAW2J2J4_9LAMI
MSDDSDDEQSIGNDSCYSDGLVDSELGIGDNESDFGIEVNWGGVGVFNSNLDNGDPQFEVGLCFPDTQSFRDAVRQHSIINARDVVFTKNDKNKVQVKCKHDTCKWKWQLTGIPCAHAISGMYFMGYKPEDYVHEYYHKSNFLRVYNHLMMPLLGPEEWPHSDRPTLLPPISERMPGRPKKQDRRKTLDEMKNKKDEVTIVVKNVEN